MFEKMLMILGAALFALLSSATLFTNSVSATSLYDQSYRTTNTLTIKGSQPYFNCNDGEISATIDWSSYLTDPTKWKTGDNWSAARSSFLATLADETNGAWGVSETRWSNFNEIVFFWTQDPSAKFLWSKDAVTLNTTGNSIGVASLSCMGNHEPHITGANPTSLGSMNMGISTKTDGNPGLVNLFTFNVDYNYPAGYSGINIKDGLDDFDNDGLSVAQESAQNTDDSVDDTDGDGLSDYIESTSFSARESVFCGVSQCAYPDPLKRDIYIENDWMDDGTTVYKLNATQIGLVANAFDGKDINLHIDTGQYGGGNELPTYINTLKVIPDSSDTDYFNLKNGDGAYNANFADNRRGIWRYMISGNKHYSDDTYTDNTSTGGAYPSDDDMVVSIGRITELSPTGTDVAIAGTVMHELGHSLCLSNISYTGQDSACLFAGIETLAGNDYPSSMNYSKQFTLVDYSQGLNPSGDHNDWDGVLKGMDDFVTLGEDPVEASARGVAPFSKPFLSGR